MTKLILKNNIVHLSTNVILVEFSSFLYLIDSSQSVSIYYIRSVMKYVFEICSMVNRSLH